MVETNLALLNEGTLEKSDVEQYMSFLNNMTIFANMPAACLAIFSCYVTVVLSATRTISLAKPLFVIRKRWIKIAFSVFMTFLIFFFALRCGLSILLNERVIKVINLDNHEKDKDVTIILTSWIFDKKVQQIYVPVTICSMLEMFCIITMVITVGILSFISVKALKNSDDIRNRQNADNRNSRRAAFMILTLSIIFVICNGIWSIATAALTLNYLFFGDSDKVTIVQILFMVLNLFIFSLNSSVNPFVYIMRNSELHQYAKTLLSELIRFLIISLQMIPGSLFLPQTP